MARVGFTSAARADLRALTFFSLETFGPVQRDRYRKALNAALRMLADNPKAGRTAETSKTLRRHIHNSHAIYYRPTPDGIIVLRILHAKQDPGRRL